MAESSSSNPRINTHDPPPASPSSEPRSSSPIAGVPPPPPIASPTSTKKRPEICGGHAPERPYPIYLRGDVEKGFGRGSKDLGCPT
ncbi:hypothetical protein IE53DRAFT_372086, partial [Violaceomyces palustris]